jgi:uncharacterized protein (AIM24 family)
MTTTINANTSAGLVYSADTSGIVKLQSNGVTTNALAWVNFNGTGTVAIRSSYNVSSITDNGTGDYTINFTNAMTDVNYVISGVASTPGSSSGFVFPYTTWGTTSAARIAAVSTAFGLTDFTYVNLAIHGN